MLEALGSVANLLHLPALAVVSWWLDRRLVRIETSLKEKHK